ncbi:MAG: hypothetical protein QXH91_07870, partial [Candidatus Bathyarchaeia archaeon]
TLTFNRVDDGAYMANVVDSVFHIVSEDKGGLKEVWSGKFQEATDKIGDIVEMYVAAINNLADKFSNSSV